MVLSVAEFKRHKWLVATAVIGLLLVVSQASGPRGKVEVAEEKASSKMAVVKLLKEVADIPRAESNVIPTMAPKMPNTRAAYIRCLDSIFSRAKDLSHCTFMPTPSKRLYAIVGDSTGRMQAQTVNPRFPIHNPHQKSPDYYVASSPRVEEGKSVDITTTLLVTNRLKDLSRLLMERMDRIAQERGIPDIVLFSGLALHECTMHHKNTDPLYRSVVEHKMGPKYNFTAAQGIGDLALHLAVPDYMLVQRECTLDLLKEFRLKYPTTTMIWRVLASASELFEGGVDRTYDVESCKKQSKYWSQERLQACNWVYNFHEDIAPELRAIGIGVVYDKAYYPQHCPDRDGVHLSHECHRILRSMVFKASLVPVPDPASYVVRGDTQRTCSSEYQESQVPTIRSITTLQYRYLTRLREQYTRVYNTRCTEIMEKYNKSGMAQDA